MKLMFLFFQNAKDKEEAMDQVMNLGPSEKKA